MTRFRLADETHDGLPDGRDLAGESELCEQVTIEQQFQHGLLPLRCF